MREVLYADWVKKAEELRDADQYARAIPYFEKAIVATPDTAKKAVGFADLGFCYAKLGKHDEARLHFKIALQTDPSCAYAYFKRGLFYHLTGNLESAITDYDHAIVLEPTLLHAYVNKGVCLAHHDDFEGALECMIKAHHAEPGDTLIIENIGRLYLHMNKPEQSLGYFIKALQLTPRSINALLNTAICYIRIPDYHTAITFVEKARGIDPTRTETHELMGDIMFSMKQYSRAVIDYVVALKYHPELDNHLLTKISSSAIKSALFKKLETYCAQARAGKLSKPQLVRILEKETRRKTKP